MTADEQKKFAEYVYNDIVMKFSNYIRQFEADAISLFSLPENGESVMLCYLSSDYVNNQEEWEKKEWLFGLGEKSPFDISKHPEAKKLLDGEKTILERGVEYYTSTTNGKRYAAIYSFVGTAENPVALISEVVSVEDVFHDVIMDVLKFELWTAVAILIAFAILMYRIYKTAIRPTLKIQRDVCTYKESKDRKVLSDSLASLASRDDEFGRLARDVDEMAGEIERYFNELIEMTAEKERLEGRIAMATNLKAHLMPSTFPAFPDEDSIDIFADQLTAVGVGGDYFDFFRVDEDQIAINMADIFAGGPEAALYMIIFKVVITSLAKMGLPVEETMRILNERLSKENEDDLSLSAWIGVLSVSEGKLEVVNAGFDAPVIIRDGKVIRPDEDIANFPVGVMGGMSFVSYELSLEHNDRLILRLLSELFRKIFLTLRKESCSHRMPRCFAF